MGLNEAPEPDPENVSKALHAMAGGDDGTGYEWAEGDWLYWISPGDMMVHSRRWPIVKPDPDTDSWHNEEGARLSGARDFSVSAEQGQAPNPATADLSATAGKSSPEELRQMDEVIKSGIEQYDFENEHPVQAKLKKEIERLEMEFRGILGVVTALGIQKHGHGSNLMRLVRIDERLDAVRMLLGLVVERGEQ